MQPLPPDARIFSSMGIKVGRKGIMKVYRGCMFTIYAVFIGAFSILFSRAFGLIGLILPPLLIAFAYLLVDTVLLELLCWFYERDEQGI